MSVFVHTGFKTLAACGLCWHAMATMTSARLVMELCVPEFRCSKVFSTFSKFLFRDTCVDEIWCWCDGGSCGVIISPAKKSGIWFVWGDCLVTKWWVCDCPSICAPHTDNSTTSSGMFLRVSSFVFNTLSMFFLSDTFPKEAVIFLRSSRSGIPLTLAGCLLDDAVYYPFAYSILRMKKLSITVESAFCQQG